MTDQDRTTPTREERTALRLEQFRRRRLIGFIVLGLVAVFALAGGYVLFGTSLVGVKTVAVAGAAGDLDRELQAAVTDAAAVSVGTPLIRIDLAAVRDRVEAVPAVASAAVSRDWPGTVRIEVTPRVPVAVVAANSALYVLDAGGVPYATVPAKPADLVSLRLATPGPGDPATMAGLTVVQALPDSLISLLTSVTARSPYDITLELTDGRTVDWGDSSDSVRKAQIVPAVLTRDGTQFDVSDPDLVTAR